MYFSYQPPEWKVFNPTRRSWMYLLTMNPNECFIFFNKESLAVGTELLIFGKDVLEQVIYRYILLNNTCSSNMQMNEPRFLFSSTSYGETTILASGYDP